MELVISQKIYFVLWNQIQSRKGQSLRYCECVRIISLTVPNPMCGMQERFIHCQVQGFHPVSLMIFCLRCVGFRDDDALCRRHLSSLVFIGFDVVSISQCVVFRCMCVVRDININSREDFIL